MAHSVTGVLLVYLAQPTSRVIPYEAKSQARAEKTGAGSTITQGTQLRAYDDDGIAEVLTFLTHDEGMSWCTRTWFNVAP